MYHLILCVPRGILIIIITMERRCGQYSVTNCRNVDAMFPPSIFENRCVDLQRSMYRLSKIDDDGSICRASRIDDRCVDLRRWMIDVLTFEDRWSLCRPSKTDDRCEIMLLHLLKTLRYICMRIIAPRVCTSVLSFIFVIASRSELATELNLPNFRYIYLLTLGAHPQRGLQYFFVCVCVSVCLSVCAHTLFW